jgi:DNA polymerase III epsilon subunit-like protein
MNFNDIIFFDFETGSRNGKKTQPTQLAAIAINGRHLKIQDGGEFNSLIKPILDDEKAIEAGLDPIQDEALKITRKTREELAEAPEERVVWDKFVSFVNQYNYKGGKWNAPIAAGYNNNGFDDFIIDRLSEKYGPWDKEYDTNKLFHPRDNIDVMKYVWTWTENNNSIRSISMDNMRKWMGMSTEGAHDALVDVRQGAELLIKFLKLHRAFANKVKFEGAFER